MRFGRLLVLALTLAACGGGEEPPGPQVDSPPAGACSATFDPCTTNTDCVSNNCHLFMQDAIQVCTVACTPNDNSTCPIDATGVNGKCNNMGICKPAAENACTP